MDRTKVDRVMDILYIKLVVWWGFSNETIYLLISSIQVFGLSKCLVSKVLRDF